MLQLDASTDEEFRRFVDWVTQSVVAQSRSLSANAVSLAKLDEGILTKIGLDKSATVVDEDFCRAHRPLPKHQAAYLIKYERLSKMVNSLAFNLRLDNYHLAGVHALEQDYFEMSDNRVMTRTVNTDELVGAPGCPTAATHRLCAVQLRADYVHQWRGPAVCPSCSKTCNFNYDPNGEGFDVTRGQG